MLTITERIPDDFLTTKAKDLHKILNGPTLLHLPGARQPPLFVSVLLHGHETTGFEAIQVILKKYATQPLPRSLSIFIGNVSAARLQKRFLDGQPDYNRIWQEGPLPEHRMTRQILDEMKFRGVFASVDIHNNTGINPHYACVTRMDHQCFHLATLFMRTVVYFTKPAGVQITSFRDLCPATTLECGQVGHERSLDHAVEFLEACMHLSAIPNHPIAPHDIDLFHSIATVSIPEPFSIGFGDEAADLRFIDDLDRLNFTELPPQTLLGWRDITKGARLLAIDEWDKEVTDRYIQYDGHEIRTRVALMPSMFTRNKEIIRQDCFGYIMERMELPKDEK